MHGPRVQPKNSAKNGEHAVARTVVEIAATALNVVDRLREKTTASPTKNAQAKPTENGIAD
jgi:hypothetical protein